MGNLSPRFGAMFAVLIYSRDQPEKWQQRGLKFLSQKKLTRAEKEIYMRDVLGLKRVVNNGRVSWVKDQSSKEPKLQYGQGVVNKP